MKYKNNPHEPEAVLSVTVGTSHSPDYFRETLDKIQCDISQWASELLDAMKMTTGPTKIDLVVTNSHWLGLGCSASTERIYEWAFRMFGVIQCPPEVGVQILLQHNNKLGQLFSPAELRSGVVVASDPVAYEGKGDGLFQICKKEGGPPALYAVDGGKKHIHTDTNFIFMQA